jgi:hypothetical protein
MNNGFTMFHNVFYFHGVYRHFLPKVEFDKGGVLSYNW